MGSVTRVSKPFCTALVLAITVMPTLGCGSEEQPKPAATVATTSSRQAIVTDRAPAGPRDPAVSLERLMSDSTPNLARLRVSCPEATDPPSYPFECTFVAADREQGSSTAGTITVQGVYLPTMSYVYETRYRPREAR
jgi:hypothetical protein